MNAAGTAAAGFSGRFEPEIDSVRPDRQRIVRRTLNVLDHDAACYAVDNIIHVETVVSGRNDVGADRQVSGIFHQVPDQLPSRFFLGVFFFGGQIRCVGIADKGERAGYGRIKFFTECHGLFHLLCLSWLSSLRGCRRIIRGRRRCRRRIRSADRTGGFREAGRLLTSGRDKANKERSGQ